MSARNDLPEPAHDERGMHMSHCNQGEYVGSCKYGDDDCPALASLASAPQVTDEAVASAIETFKASPDLLGVAMRRVLEQFAASAPSAVEDAVKEVERLKGSLRYIQQQAKSRPSGDSLTLSVIERNAEAALNDSFQAAISARKP